MKFEVGDMVRVSVPKSSLCWAQPVDGKIFKVVSFENKMSGNLYLLDDGYGFYYREEWLFPADKKTYRYAVGDQVKIRSINQILKDYSNNCLHPLDVSLAKYCGETHKVTGCGYFECPVYTLEGVPGCWSEMFLEKLEDSVNVNIWVDFSISESQYKRICKKAEATGLPAMKVLSMLIDAGMQLIGEEEDPG